MKRRLIAIVAVSAMLLSLIPLFAIAGPLENGFIHFSYLDEDDCQVVLPVYYDKDAYSWYDDEGGVEPAREYGLEYDESTNTLVLDNVDLSSIDRFELFSIQNMGNDFKIEVRGQCNLGELVEIDSKESNANITIYSNTANSSLDIGTLYFDSRNGYKAKLHIENNVTVVAHSLSSFNMYGSDCNPNKDITYSGQMNKVKFEYGTLPQSQIIGYGTDSTIIYSPKDPKPTKSYNVSQASLNDGDDLNVYMTEPDPSSINTAEEQSFEDGSQYWYNEIAEPIDATVDQRFALDLIGDGTDLIDPDDPAPAYSYSIYADNLYSEDRLVASVENGKMRDATGNPIEANTVEPANGGGSGMLLMAAPIRARAAESEVTGYNVSVTIPADTLEPGTVYYFVLDKNMVTSEEDAHSMNTDVVFKFTTEVQDENPLMLTSSYPEMLLTNESRTTIAVENGKEDYQYHFVVRNNDTENEWSPWDGYQPKSSFVWYAGPKAAENGKTITAYVQDAQGNTVGDPLVLDATVLESELHIRSFSCNDRNPLASDTVDLGAEAFGGYGMYEYRFRVVNNNTGKSYTIQDYTLNGNTCNWWAGPKGGSKTVYVDARDIASGAIATKQLIVGVSDTNLKVDSISSSIEDLKASDRTTLTANVTDPPNGLKYRFYVFNNDTGKLWQIQDYNDKNNCSWYAGPSGGNKTIYVDVKDGDTFSSLTLDVDIAD